jgi:hypothetical protein
MEAVREHPVDLVRDQYVMLVAERTHIEPDRLRGLLDGAGRRMAAPTAPPRRPEGPEVEALRLAVHRPEEVADTLHEALFSDPVVLDGYRALCSATTLPQAVDNAEPEVASLLRRLAVEEPGAATADVLARLAEEAAKRVIAELEADARRSGQLTEDVAWLKLAIAEVREPATAIDATGRLVRWLVDRFEVEA